MATQNPYMTPRSRGGMSLGKLREAERISAEVVRTLAQIRGEIESLPCAGLPSTHLEIAIRSSLLGREINRISEEIEEHSRDLELIRDAIYHRVAEAEEIEDRERGARIRL